MRSSEEPRATEKFSQNRERKLSAEDAAARQASAESAEAQRIQRAEHEDVVESVKMSKRILNVLLINIPIEPLPGCFQTWTKILLMML